jgi:hypothetical protein
MREPANVKMELFIGDGADIAGLAFEDQGGFVFARGAEVAVEAVLGNVQFAADEPFRVWRLPIEDFFEGLAPNEVLLGLPVPEFFWAIDRFIIEPFVSGITPKIGLGFELGRRPE